MSWLSSNLWMYSVRFYQTTVTMGILILAAQSMAKADVVLIANSFSNLGNGPPSQQGSSGTVTDTGGGRFATDFAESRSSATFGQLRAYSYLEDGIGGATNGTFAWSRASFRDDMLFDAAGRTGTQGTVVMKFTVDGSLSASRSANTEAYQPGSDDTVLASAEYTFRTGQDTYIKSQSMRSAQWASANATSQSQGTPFLGIEQTYIVPFTFGTALQGVGLELFIRAEGAGYDQGVRFATTALADLEHTANWGGFGEVRDANGNLVTNYSFSSGSGFNYTQSITAVPEPSSCILFAVGGVLVAHRRLRNSRGSRINCRTQ